MSRSAWISRTISCCPSAPRCCQHVLAFRLGVRRVRLHQHADGCRLGHQSAQQPMRFAPSTPEKKCTPVTLPPGRFRLLTKPSALGSPLSCEDDRNRRARSFGCENRRDATLTITITGRRANSAAEPASDRPGLQRYSCDVLIPDKPARFAALAERISGMPRRRRRAAQESRSPAAARAGETARPPRRQASG